MSSNKRNLYSWLVAAIFACCCPWASATPIPVGAAVSGNSADDSFAEVVIKGGEAKDVTIWKIKPNGEIVGATVKELKSKDPASEASLKIGTKKSKRVAGKVDATTGDPLVEISGSIDSGYGTLTFQAINVQGLYPCKIIIPLTFVEGAFSLAITLPGDQLSTATGNSLEDVRQTFVRWTSVWSNFSIPIGEVIEENQLYYYVLGNLGLNGVSGPDGSSDGSPRPDSFYYLANGCTIASCPSVSEGTMFFTVEQQVLMGYDTMNELVLTGKVTKTLAFKVPEPTTLALISLSLIALCGTRIGLTGLTGLRA